MFTDSQILLPPLKHYTYFLQFCMLTRWLYKILHSFQLILLSFYNPFRPSIKCLIIIKDIFCFNFVMQVARILLFVYLFYHVYLHYDQVLFLLNYFCPGHLVDSISTLDMFNGIL